MDWLKLRVPYKDTSTKDVSLSLTAAPRDGLAKQQTVVDQHQVEIVILGSSHQLVVHRANEEPLVETVACDLTNSTLPKEATTQAGSHSHLFEANIQQFTSYVPFTAAIKTIVSSLENHSISHTMAAYFPGSVDAFTAVSVSTTDLRWKTWHTYPDSLSILTTTSELATNGDHFANQTRDGS